MECPPDTAPLVQAAHAAQPSQVALPAPWPAIIITAITFLVIAFFMVVEWPRNPRSRRGIRP